MRSWLYAIARNAAIDWGQAYKRRASVALDDVPEASDDQRSLDPVGSTAGAELKTILLRAVEALPALYREPFVMRHLEDWSYQEIGEILGLPLETVETRLVRARRLLKEMLKGKVDV
ncbi:MAG: RNA polymerase sigma factor [Planctomycetes bacterium]|nr:RNA polymerase sigma factor [Planctomycetota bacterium]